ncbi:conserved hypothetical protein [Culex quinquefasciatus]|uniref:CHK kinase-like domain-containing protein n=1 Tax=Culex quinquefasciatus TaxID=7176 RepID=B0WUL1_CULQU|nr:conserved hypothetical protein [Culex quinquefasciatus]|eukprot:XP_001858934.1 conserved hypothetical protein [Culex quinquefasciatus]
MAINGDWITAELLERTLLAEEGANECRFRVVGHKVEAATKKGDNYASEMYRVIIEYEMDGKRHKCTRIMKVIPSGDIQRKVMEKNNIFPREIAVYRDILPRISKLLQSIADPVQISPVCTYTTDDPKTMLVFEDIKEREYQMVDRRIGLNLEQTKLVLRKLAKLHAGSAVVYQEDPEVMEPVMEGAITTNPHRQDFLVFYKMCARQVVKLVESWSDPSYGEILKKIRNLPNTTIAKGCQVYTRDDAVFNVLNHDDVWTSNLMFRKEQNESSIRVHSIDVSYALSKGENYVSIIFRSALKVQSKSQPLHDESYIVKYTPKDGAANLKMNDYNVHEKEMNVYELVIPKFDKMMLSIGDFSKLFPKTLAVDREHDAIIFEDLNHEGFVMADRVSGLGFEHTKKVLVGLAKLHACSLKLIEMEPAIFDRFNIGILTRHTTALYSMFQSSFDALIEEMKTWDSKWQYYCGKLEKMQPYFIENSLAVTDHECEVDLRVLNHGDPWTNNMMFLNDSDGKPVDVVLLDLQFCNYTTPAADLFYFFYTSTEDEIRQNCFEELMQYYYNHFSDYLTPVNSSIVPLPIAINEVTCDADFEGLTGNDDRTRQFKRTVMANKKYHKIIQALLPVFDRKGLLDTLK